MSRSAQVVELTIERESLSKLNESDSIGAPFDAKTYQSHILSLVRY